MSTQRVLYTDKETFQVSPLPEIQKATAANYNELKDVVNFNAQELDDIFSIITADVSAIQNTFTSDITAQTGTKTFDGDDWTIDVTGRTSTGKVNFLHFKKTDTGTASVFEVDIDGQITANADEDITTTLGRAVIHSATGDLAMFSHVDQVGTTKYGLAIESLGTTIVNALTNESIKFAIDNVKQWEIDASSLVGSSGNTLSVQSKIFANDRIAFGLTTGDVASPLEAEVWFNDTIEKLRINEGGVIKNVITVETATIQLTQAQIQSLFSTPIDIVPAPGAGIYIQPISGSAFLDHNGTTYATANQLQIGNTTGTTLFATTSSFIDSAADESQILFEFGTSSQVIPLNTALSVSANANAINNGGTIDVFVQYILINTN